MVSNGIVVHGLDVPDCINCCHIAGPMCYVQWVSVSLAKGLVGVAFGGDSMLKKLGCLLPAYY